jgi:hypothetical protein
VVRLALLLATLALAGCEPDIGSGAYYCGPDRTCPPGLRCDDSTAVCRFPREAEPFVCPEGSNDHEPDETSDAAFDLGVVGCGAGAVAVEGCVDNAPDVDHYALTPSASCGTVHVTLQAPIAFAQLALDVVDGDGAVVATGTVCEELDGSGQVGLCADAAVSGAGPYYARVTMLDGGDACDGACAYNRYHLSAN